MLLSNPKTRPNERSAMIYGKLFIYYLGTGGLWHGYFDGEDAMLFASTVTQLLNDALTTN